MIFPNTVYLTFFTHNLTLNRYSFLISTILLILLTIFHIIKLYTKSKKNESNISSVDLTASKKTPSAQSPDSSLNDHFPEWKSTASNSNSNTKHKNESMISKIYTIYKKGKQGKYVILSQLMTLFTLFFFILHGIIDTLDFYGIFHGILSCKAVRVLAAITWHNGKTSMYFIFYSRIQLAFTDTSFEYSKKTMYTLLFLVFNLWISFMIGDIFEINGVEIYDKQYNIFWCQQLVPRWGCIATPIFDGAISILYLYLFIKPLYNIMSYCNHFDVGSVSVIVKYFTLTFICIFTTTIVLIILIFKNWGIIFTFDVLINAISILMMTQDYHRYYTIFCAHCGPNLCVDAIMSKADNKKRVPHNSPKSQTQQNGTNQTSVKIEIMQRTQTTSEFSADHSKNSRAFKSIAGIPIGQIESE